ncbi:MULTISPECIES: hypothetical protein [Enterobacterales]|jgi:hypothetical protein|uniref:Uncharacterized protein n=5 Tax=Morganellaceae TaxID=1903414 RepID=A0A899NIH0_PROST|nr:MULTISPECIES: hypothetical protein [Enterobacterales]URQ57437.1 Hypothetical protein [Providencia alcalifaciens]EKH6496487.1 hypothetical protein [Providencia rettgeri]ELB1110429.1 hypothetical protein [Morganella morganii]ELL8907435.1 hypothetical protein [Proteus mirabilis]ELQ1458012.1 hypothetical protein [Providencia rettgeri]
MNKFRITHTYATRKDDFYAIETMMNLHQVDLAVAYLQFMHFNLPTFNFLNDGLCELDVIVLMHRIYGANIITDRTAIKAEVDLYVNWEHQLSRIHKTLPELHEIARPGVNEGILFHLWEMGNRILPMLKQTNQALYDEALLQLPRIDRVLKGTSVDPAWGWESFDGERCDGNLYTKQSTPDFLVRLF